MSKPKSIQDDTYEITEHVHRFAAWAASRAASQKECRFKAGVGMKIINRAGLKDVLLGGPDGLPDSPHMDAWHREWRKKVLKAASAEGKTFSHGVASKLVNVYLKAGMVTIGNQTHERVGALHPPIDHTLMERLAVVDHERASFWTDARWTTFSSRDYQVAIDNVRLALAKLDPQNAKRMWMIERYFAGYRS